MRSELVKRNERAKSRPLLYGEVRPGGLFRFANFGHPPPLVFSAEFRRFMNIDEDLMMQFLALGLQIPSDHPDRKKYYSLASRQKEFSSSDIAEITLMSPGDILVLYTDGVFDGSDEQARRRLEAVLQEHYRNSARDICNALLDYAVRQDEQLRETAPDLIDDKTVFIIKRT
ncbi:MAG TPA: SpoIIE family protein phosphatase [Terriglobales bacterium]|nr:SpoIIE family protein phosphatase [Terriglobales bacterium]